MLFMRQLLIILTLISIFSSLVAASSVITNKDSYNFGDKISATYEFVPVEDADSLFKLSIVCEAYELLFFTYPLSLKAGQAVKLDIPKVTASGHMFGECHLDAVVESFNGAFFERATSASFIVTDLLNISAKLSEEEVLPGGEILVYGAVTPSYGAFFGSLFAGIDLPEPVNLVDNSFVYSLTVPSNSLSGERFIRITANDSFGNSAEKALSFFVKQIATSLKHTLNRTDFDPGETVKVSVALLDQSNTEMNASVNLQVISSLKNILFDEIVDAGDLVDVALPGSSPPGTYKVKSSYDGIKAEDSFYVTTLEKLDAVFDSRNLKLTNNGNVRYDDRVEIIFKGRETFSASKNVNLGVGQYVVFDLFKEVSSDMYDIEVRRGNELVASYQSISITDERSLIEKAVEKVTGTAAEKIEVAATIATSGAESNESGGEPEQPNLGAITSQITVENKSSAKNLFWGFALVVIIGLAVFLFYEQKKKRAALGMPKEKDEVEKVFEKDAKETAENVSEEEKRAFEKAADEAFKEIGGEKEEQKGQKADEPEDK